MNHKKWHRNTVSIILTVGIILLCCCPSSIIGGGWLTYRSIFQKQPDKNASQIQIIAQKNFTLVDEGVFLANASMDTQGSALIDWAKKEGSIDQELKTHGGAEIEYSDGNILRGVVLGNVQLLQFVALSGKSSYVFSKIEGTPLNPQVVLFDQEGKVEIDQHGLTVYEHGQKLGSTESSFENPLPHLATLSSQGTNQCTTGIWNEFWSCLEAFGSKIISVLSCMSTIYAVFAACGTTGPLTLGATCIAALAGALVFCGVVGMVCSYYAITDDTPEASISLWTNTGEEKWIDVTFPDAEIKEWVKKIIWKAKLTVTDDRKPAPRVFPPSDWITVASGESVKVSVVDCANQKLEKEFFAPEVSLRELQTLRNDNPESPTPTPKPTPIPAEEKIKTYGGIGEITMSLDTDTNRWICRPENQVYHKYTYRFETDGTLTLIAVDGMTLQYPWFFTPNPEDDQGFIHVDKDEAGNIWDYRIHFFDDSFLYTVTHTSAPDGITGSCEYIHTLISRNP